MEKFRPFIILGVGVIIALITSVIAYNWLQKKAEMQEVVSTETQPVMVAATALSWGTLLKKEMVKEASFFKESLPEGFFSDASSLEGRVLIFPVNANEPIFESRLAPVNVKTGGVAAIITPKNRAMAVKVDKVIGVSGFIKPGNRVDVLVTLNKVGKKSTPITKIVLQNILVMTVGSQIERKGKEEKPVNVGVITLEVTPKEAEKLALATTKGRLQLAMRNFNDTEDVLTRGATPSTLLASYRPVEKKTKKVYRKKGKPKSTPVFSKIEFIIGNKVSEVKVKD